MTATHEIGRTAASRTGPDEPPGHGSVDGRAGRWRSPVWLACGLGLGCGLLAMLVRAIGIVRSNDVFVDELLYTDFARQIAHGQFPNEGGRPFLLHPPGSLALDGLVIHVFGLSGSPIQLVLEVRWVNAVLGAVTVVLVFAIVRKVTNLPLAVVAAVVVTFDPFVLRNNGRVMIETPAVTWLLAGWLVLLTAGAAPSPGRARRGQTAAGLLLGLALVTKDVTAVPALGAAFVAVVWRHSLPWRTAVRVALSAAVPYVVYLVFLTGAGLMPLWIDDKRSGFLRMTGVLQVTGFNAAPVGLDQRLVAELPRFATSYVLLGIAVPLAVIASFSPTRAGRFLGLAGVCTGLMGVYAVVGGAAEEQFGYYVVLTAVPAAAVAAHMLRGRGLVLESVVSVAGAAFVVATIMLGVASRTVTDDGFLQAQRWMAELPPGADVAVTGVTGEYAFPDDDVSPSLTSLLGNGNNYVLTSSAPLEQGYGYASPKLIPWLERNARPVHEFSGPSNGHTVLWRLDRAALVRSVESGVSLPPIPALNG